MADEQKRELRELAERVLRTASTPCMGKPAAMRAEQLLMESATALAGLVLEAIEEPKPREPSPHDWVCHVCGSDEVQYLEWVEVNTGRIAGGNEDDSNYYCTRCEDHHQRLTERKDFKPQD